MDTRTELLTKPLQNEVKTRIIWAAVAAALLILVIWFLGPECTFVVATVAGMLGWREYARLMGLEERVSLYYLGYLLLGLMFTHTFFIGPHTLVWIWLAWATALFTLFFETLYLRKQNPIYAFNPQQGWTEICRFVLGLIYIFLMFGFIGSIVSKVRGEQVITLAFCATFFGDGGAYFVGRAKGRRKIWPELSPGKTIEGAWGGCVASVLASVLVWGFFALLKHDAHLPFWQCLLVGVIASPLGQAGDFLESLMKRVSGRKDSGTLMPGHGGILDRADSLIFVMPLIYFLF